jgi:hypothetical protein
MYGWDHEVYLELGQNGENCLKWGANANTMTKSISLSNIEDLQIIDTNGYITPISISPIRHGFAPGFVNNKKGCTRLAAASDNIYELHAHGRWFSPGTPASSITKTDRHDIAEILLKVALDTINQINQSSRQKTCSFLHTLKLLFVDLLNLNYIAITFISKN